VVWHRRGNFLDLLRADHDDNVINAEALAYMRQRALSGPVIARLAEHPERVFPDQASWTAHLDRLGNPVTVATEGALWGSIKAHGFLPDTVIVNDDPGQFNVGPAWPVLGSCRASRSQAPHLHR
jgi:hypothetical protein